MSLHQIRINTENFRALAKADIIIDGITVVAGENGSGKSTLSKLLYYSFKSALNYENLIATDLRFKLRNVHRFLEIVVSELHKVSNERNTREEFKQLHELRYSFDSVSTEELEKWILFIEKIENNYNSQRAKGKGLLSDSGSSRLRYMVRDLLDDDSILFDDEVRVPFKKIILLLNKLFDDAIKKTKERPIEVFLDELRSIFSDGILPEKFEVYEFDESIVSTLKSSLSIPYSIQNCIYIDTPMMLGVDISDNSHWDDLSQLLLLKDKPNTNKLIGTISKEIISGDVALNENHFSGDEFSFRRSDGNIYRLLDCATGIKSFGILQLLLKNGSLTDKTLLIIDEPESHLHPQWIIEYARIIVLLNKEIGIKFFITSHNPDMISAIKYISKKEGVDDKLHFYIAEKGKNDFLYSYENLGTDIEPIFESFNIALDRISLYGGV